MHQITLFQVVEACARGLQLTILLTVTSAAVSFIVGLALGLLAAPGGVLARAVRWYCEFWRAMPLLVTLFIVFFGLPSIGINIEVWIAVSLGLSLWGSANVGEITRGAINSIPHVQYEAGFGLGMSWFGVIVRVIAPQAIRRMIPSAAGIFTELLHGTAIGTVLGAIELTSAAQQQMEILTNVTGFTYALPIMSGVLLVYFVVSAPVTFFARWAEKRLSR